jgi:hypothetical protein
MEPDEMQRCPHIKVYSDGQIVEPSYPSFFVEGVTGLYKRFYKGYCHLQLLFDRKKGDMIWRQWKKTGDWTAAMSILFDVVQITFIDPINYGVFSARFQLSLCLRLQLLPLCYVLSCIYFLLP